MFGIWLRPDPAVFGDGQKCGLCKLWLAVRLSNKYTAVTAHTLQIPVLRTSDTEEAHVVTRGVRRSRKRPMHSRDVTSPSALDMLRLHCIVLSARDVFACFHPGS